jgi:ribosomal protein S18 acetylase RimI-like enzyme
MTQERTRSSPARPASGTPSSERGDSDFAAAVTTVREADLPDLLPLMRGYCDFYDVAPGDEALLALSRALIADPRREGVQLIARDDDGNAIGFATVYWTWSTASAARIGAMNDLYVAPEGRGSGAADALIAACVERVREHGGIRLEWQTALDNTRAQAVYDRVGGHREQWLDYSLPIEP